MNETVNLSSEEAAAGDELQQTPRVWRDAGWTARVIKNEDDEGWAVAMIKDGEREPALVGPWTMGRDKKNPKPLDNAAFLTLVKTASEIIRRHEQQLQAILHKKLDVAVSGVDYRISLEIVPDDDDPFAILIATNRVGEELAKMHVRPDFKLTQSSAIAWIESGFPRIR